MIMAIDPGETSGIAIFKTTKRFFSLVKAYQVNFSELKSLKLEDVVVLENYFITPYTNTVVAEAFGFIKASCTSTLVIQGPYVPSITRKQFPQVQPKLPPHARDAFWHGFHYCVGKGLSWK